MKIKFHFFLLALLAFTFLCTGCAKSLFVANGARDSKPLIFNNEYELKDLKPVTVEGAAFWGIPSFTKNNQNGNKTGLLLSFNGIELGTTKRILPILSLIGYSLLTQQVVQKIGGRKTTGGSIISLFDDYRLNTWVSYLIGLPIAGVLNNFTWQNAAFSGASATMYYRLVTENPTVDVFFYPKYEVQSRNVFSDEGINLRYLWFQEAKVKAKVSGGILKKSK